jgi:CRISPR-associated endonuclease Cas1
MAATKTVAQRLRLRKSSVPEILAAHPHLGITPRHGVVTLFGYGIQVRVDRGHLILEDGIGADRRYARLPRIGHGLRRLVVIGSDGMVSLSALCWLTGQDAAFVMLDRAGRVLTTVGPARNPDGRMRRAQALAIQSGAGLRIARELINQKLAGQERIASNNLGNPAVADTIAEFRSALPHVEAFDAIRFLESQAGAAYWSAWRNLPVTFPRKDLPRVPAHWQVFQTRSSPLSGRSARLAVNPPNSIINYLCAVLESEARLAATALGLDPALGFLHADSAHRDSLVFDLMEPVRPQVEAFVLDWITREPLKREWFFEQRDGNCRLMAELASRLSETAQTWRRAIAPIAEFVTRSLWSIQRNSDRQRGPATHLTQQHRREANNVAFAGNQGSARRQSLCRTCGVPVAPGRSYCAACGVTYSTERLVKAGEAGRKRSHSPEGEARRAEAARKNALAQWHWDPSTQPEWLTQESYVNKIHPLLAKAPITAIVSATGLRRSSAAENRRGRRIPHPRHWRKLAELVGVSANP